MKELNREGAFSPRQTASRILALCKTNIRSIFKWAAFVIIVTELAGIWNDVHHIRKEEVKNAWSALPRESQQLLQPNVIKHYESTSYVEGAVSVDGSVSIDGDVNLSEPVEVEIER